MINVADFDIGWHCNSFVIFEMTGNPNPFTAAMRETAKQIMVIDDIADRQHDCDVLMDQNYKIWFSESLPLPKAGRDMLSRQQGFSIDKKVRQCQNIWHVVSNPDLFRIDMFFF